MRIRKRAVPLPLSLLSPVPFPPSDPHLVQLPTSFQPSDHLHLLSPDQPLSSGNDRHPATAPPPPRLRVRLAYEDEMNKDQGEEISNPSKQSDSGAVADHGRLPLPSTPSSHEKIALGDGSADGRWCDGDKAIPLKKRKASFEMNGVIVSEEESKMKSKTNKKCALLATLDGDDQDDDDYNVDDSDPISTDDNGHNKTKKATRKTKGNNGSSGGAKKKPSKSKKKGGSIMEGSRCSRVNGRGWRCMQPTLVGYSLCEHHLGKGRLRSMSIVRALAKPEEKACNGELGHYGVTTGIGIQEDYGDEKKPNLGGAGAGSKTKRRRNGMVKARSLSSLLCQPNTPVVHLGSTTTTTTTLAIKHA